MRVLVSTLLESVPQMFDVLILMCFVFAIFGIIGQQVRDRTLLQPLAKSARVLQRRDLMLTASVRATCGMQIVIQIAEIYLVRLYASVESHCNAIFIVL